MNAKAEQYFSLYEQYRGERPSGKVEVVEQDEITRIKAEGHAEVTIGRNNGWALAAKSYPEGNDYEPARRLGWPGGRGWPAKIACIFADYYARGEKPPYLSQSPAQFLAGRSRTSPKRAQSRN